MQKRFTMRTQQRKKQRLATLALSLVLALLFTGLFAGTLFAQESDTSATDTSTSSETETPAGSPVLQMDKTVNRTQAAPGAHLAYTVQIDNIGGDPALGVMMTDTLPADVTYVNNSLSVTGGGSAGIAGSVITWTGNISDSAQVIVSFTAYINPGTTPGTIIENSAELAGPGGPLADSATTTVIDPSIQNLKAYLPVVTAPPPPPPGAPILSITRASYENSWTVAWTNVGADVFYELQESQTPDFASVTIYNMGNSTSTVIQKSLTIHNEYFYRVRAYNTSGSSGWSNAVQVIGAYRDDFTTTINDWSIRRTTFIEEVTVFHEVRDGNGLLILRVEDSWDWGIASPMVRAPEPPYVIEYRTQIANFGNLVSHGLAVGGDFPGDICPDWSSLAGVYEHSLCFNHFYLPNVIWYGPLKVQFEQVDYLVWCPTCGGSPMKRLSDNYGNWFLIDPLNSANPSDWNTWKIEVRPDGLRMFVNGQQYATLDDTRWVNDPYFGVFGSTDEYSNSTWRWDYVEVRPLDN